MNEDFISGNQRKTQHIHIEELKKERATSERRLTLSLCSLRLTMTAVICWSRKTRIVANRAGSIARMDSHHGSIDPGFTRNESLYQHISNSHDSNRP